MFLALYLLAFNIALELGGTWLSESLLRAMLRWSGTFKILYINSKTWCVVGWPPLY